MTIIFDLSGVFFNAGLKVAIAKISKEFELEPDVVEYVLNKEFAADYRKGLVEPEKFWAKAKEYLRVDDIKYFKKLFFESYFPIPETVQLVEKLKKEGHKVAYLSNNPRDRADYLDQKYNFKKLFDFGMLSCEAHAWKPEPKIYQQLLDKFKLEPKSLIYIDDKERFLIPASKMGIKTILFKDIKQVERELVNIINN